MTIRPCDHVLLTPCYFSATIFISAALPLFLLFHVWCEDFFCGSQPNTLRMNSRACPPTHLPTAAAKKAPLSTNSHHTSPISLKDTSHSFCAKPGNYVWVCLNPCADNLFRFSDLYGMLIAQ